MDPTGQNVYIMGPGF